MPNAGASAAGGGVPKRYIVAGLCFLATFICYIDRVNISVAIIPMAEQFGWSATTKGLVLSSFFIGYMAAMVPAGWLAHRPGGKLLLGIALGALDHGLAHRQPWLGERVLRLWHIGRGLRACLAHGHLPEPFRASWHISGRAGGTGASR